MMPFLPHPYLHIDPRCPLSVLAAHAPQNQLVWRVPQALRCAARLHQIYVKLHGILTHMTKTQVYFPDEDLEELRSVGRRTGRSVADLVREAVRRVWLRSDSSGPVALWDGTPTKTSLEHDAIYDEA